MDAIAFVKWSEATIGHGVHVVGPTIVDRMPSEPSRTASGAQTLARGLSALRAVALAADGMSVQELGDLLGVHRTIAYRILSTLVEAGLVSRGKDGRYRGGVGLLELHAAAYGTLKHVASTPLAVLADELGATVSLLVPESDEAVALLVISPRGVRYHIAFAEGSRHPLDRGAAGRALRAAMPATKDEASEIAEVRARGYAITHGEVEPGAWGLAAPISVPSIGLVACVNVITHRDDLVTAATDRVLACARELERLFADEH
jgi:DNA-binding IclR family transcriptional regulator